MALKPHEYKRKASGRRSSSLLYFEEQIDASLFTFMEYLVGSLVYQGKAVTGSNGTKLAMDLINGFYTKYPLEANEEIDGVVNDIVAPYSHQVDKANAIFEWITRSIIYGSKKRGATGYRTSLETFRTREGVCGEMAILFIAMATMAGINCSYVSVTVDTHGKQVHHACASIYHHLGNAPILIDPAYRTFGIKHQNYTYLDVKQLNAKFVRFRHLSAFPQADVDLSALGTLFPD